MLSFFLHSGEVFHSSVPGRLSLSSASDRCVSLGGQLATVGQLYLAWRAGLDSCAPGWLSDGSVRYPVTWPRADCGGSEPGVRTVTPNDTADNTTALYDAYCYRGATGGATVFVNSVFTQYKAQVLLIYCMMVICKVILFHFTHRD